jgi:hypothetical protein
MFHRAIISGMAVNPEDLAVGALALQVFVKNAKNVEIIVNVAFATIPTILGIGAAGLLGSGIINTAKDVRNSISLLRTAVPMMQLGLMAGKGLNIGRKRLAEWAKQKDHPFWRGFGNVLTPVQWYKSRRGKNNQDTQSKQDKQDSGGGGGGGSPPVPPDTKPSEKKEENTKSEAKKEERPKSTGIETYSPIDVLNPFKKK